jgi:hypothetical protein
MSEILDLNFYSSTCLKVVTKQSKLEPLRFNVYQKELTRIVQEEMAKGKPIRILVLKCRQIGGSTWAGAFNFHQVATNPFRNGLVIAHDEDSTNKLFNMCKRFYDFLPARFRPMKRFSNRKELKFENPNEDERGDNPGLMSGLEVETANNLNAGRGSPIQNLHISELAFWKNASTVLTGLFQSVPYEPETSIIIESTANGVSGHGQEFYERCMKAMKNEGDNQFRFVFFKWTHNPEYEIEPPPGFKLTEFEEELVKLHPELTPRKLAWRRYKIANEMGSTIVAPEDQFKQEYPLTPEEAFISSGRPVFDTERINADIERARSIEFIQCDAGEDRIIPSAKGMLKVYKTRQIGRKYAIGADVAEGLETGDFSTMTVLNKNLEQVASFHGHLHPDAFGEEMVKVGRLYDQALLAPEVNNHGLTTLTHITKEFYPCIFMRKVLDERTNQYTDKAGWQTNSKTKVLMLDEFIAAYRKKEIKINDIDLLREMATLTIEPDGSVNLNGKDRVVSFCIALQAIKQVHEVELGAFDTTDDRPKKIYEDRANMAQYLGVHDSSGGYDELD